MEDIKILEGVPTEEDQAHVFEVSIQNISPRMTDSICPVSLVQPNIRAFDPKGTSTQEDLLQEYADAKMDLTTERRTANKRNAIKKPSA